MRWLLVIPGQPYSWNQSYHIVTMSRKGYGRGGDFRTIAKTKEAKAYTDLVTTLAGPARPSGWHPSGFVVVEYYYFLGRDIDADNVMKLVDDGLARALGVDDKWFLPRAMSKTVGLRPNQRRIELVIGDLQDFESSSPEVDPSTLLRISSFTSSLTEHHVTQSSSFVVDFGHDQDGSSGSSPSGVRPSGTPSTGGTFPILEAAPGPSSTVTARWSQALTSSSPSSPKTSA